MTHSNPQMQWQRVAMFAIVISSLLNVGGYLIKTKYSGHPKRVFQVPVDVVVTEYQFNESDAGRHVMMPSQWLSILDPAANKSTPGFVHVDGSPNIWGVSMYHQLHCLVGLERILGLIFDGNELVPQDAAHLRHCTDYLSQASLCAADGALELIRGESLDHDDLLSVDTIGPEHQCKDWTRIRDWVKANTV